MSRTAVALLFVLSLATLAFVNGVANLYSLYWVYLWLDMPMHVLGGVVTALGLFSFSWLARFRQSFFQTLLVVLVVGIAWELFEFFVGSPREALYLFDTTSDLVLDLVGGAIGYSLARSLSTLDR